MRVRAEPSASDFSPFCRGGSNLPSKVDCGKLHNSWKPFNLQYPNALFASCSPRASNIL